MKAEKPGKRAGKIASDRNVKISFTLNGKQVTCDITPSVLLIDLLRDTFNLKGAKSGCREGECGACSVLVNGYAVNACLFLAVNAEGREITTIEGLCSNGKPDAVQNEMVRQGAVQCGFCSPGIAISIKSMKNHWRVMKHKPAREEIQKMLEGNLCRCTGYVKIISAAEKAILDGKL